MVRHTFGTLIAGAIVALLAGQALADTTITTTRDCYSKHSRASGSYRNCSTDVVIKRDPPPRPIIVEPPKPYAPPSVERGPGGVFVVRGH